MLKKVREPIVEGIFYPSDPEHLKQLIKTLLGESKSPALNIRGLIVPHAGYRYAGTIAADAYKAARNIIVKRVVILAPVHRDETDEIILPESHFFRMPTGMIPVDQDLMDELASCSNRFRKDDIPHLEEHCIEVQLPFIHALFPEADIAPILVGNLVRETANVLGNALTLTCPAEDSQTLFVVSSNMTSYLNGNTAEKESDILLSSILENNPGRIFQGIEDGEISSCGAGCIAVILAYFGKNHTIKLFSQGNSGQTNNNFDERVHYAAIGILA
ncbi:MAG: AmmeMemoRadiSam system protein B [Spirochaetales bacterium]|nr:AmmeMemoRadiSam system protein B [Spirochaetales bacterium]